MHKADLHLAFSLYAVIKLEDSSSEPRIELSQSVSLRLLSCTKFENAPQKQIEEELPPYERTQSHDRSHMMSGQTEIAESSGDPTAVNSSLSG
jgi:hypothetical protein